MKKAAALLIIILSLSLFPWGCAPKKTFNRYTGTIFETFDTMIQITAYTNNKGEFDHYYNMARGRFQQLHKLFDIYHDYPGLNNIKTINDHAGIKPVRVEGEVIDLIAFSQKWCGHTGGKANIALGPLLEIWHDYRTKGMANPEIATVPPLKILREAMLHTDINNVVVDKAQSTVFLTHQGMALDVGAVAKGFAVEIVARELVAAGLRAGVINAGGNVRTIGIPPDGREKWAIGIEDPTGSTGIFATLNIGEGAVVTSSGQQRYYVVDGEVLHHIIDPKTLWPASFYQAVTVVAPDSGLADFLSTALFLLPYTEGHELSEELEDVEVIWIMPGGEIKSTKGLEAMINTHNGSGK